MDDILRDTVDAVNYLKRMKTCVSTAPKRESVLPEVSGANALGVAWLPVNEYEDDSYLTDEMLEELQPRYEDG